MRILSAVALLFLSLACPTLGRAASPPAAGEPHLPLGQLAADNFGADAPWFLANIPFLEIDDAEIQQIYFYRWKLLRSHIREIGSQGVTLLEFLPDVSWAREPYTDLNDSASFHIAEARWLRSPAVVDSLIDHLYTGGGNDRHFSESIAAATEASTRVTGDPAPALRHLDAMQHIFNLWDDHFDRARNLYWIEPLLDATEYTISSTDASGAGFTKTPSTDQNHNGFTGGQAFRPSINSYQYANALAIAHLATLSGQPAVAADYTRRAERIRSAVITQLWNPSLQHFTDRYQRGTKFVTAGDFIRGRELVGYTPWFYELPPSTPSPQEDFSVAWKHVINPAELAGARGLRTAEPSYPRYLTQYRYDDVSSQAECQWNGPSWPFQTSQTLTAMANLLDDYHQATVTPADYLHLLRQYTHQHLLASAEAGTSPHPDIQEDYNPDTGAPIVGLPRSHHYSHSTYVDLVLSGLLGIRPSADEVLEVAPLIDPSVDHPIHYFALQNLAYHGHTLGLVYDVDGSRYHIGSGLSIFVDGERAFGPAPLARVKLPLPSRSALPKRPSLPIDLAVNVGTPDGPLATASSSSSPTGVAEAIDGRLWFFPEIANGWSPSPADSSLTSTFSIDLRSSVRIGSIELYFLADGSRLQTPSDLHIEYQSATGWQPISQLVRTPRRLLGNGVNRISFPPVLTQRLRIILSRPAAPSTFRMIEFKAFAP